MRQTWRKVVSSLVCLTVIINLAGWLPAAEAAIISTNQEISMGRDVARDLERRYGLVDDPALQERVDRIGKQIVAVSDRKDLPYTFKVLNAKEVNALAVPGGFIYIFKGLVDYMPSDEELAGIIGHEVGHIVKRHTVRQIEKSLGLSIAFGLIFGSEAAFLQNLALNAIMAGYSRDDEREADQMGFIQTMRAGYNPYSMIMGLNRLAELEHKGDYGLFSSHPEPEARVALQQKYINDAKVQPQVVRQDKSAQIRAPNLNLPPLYATYQGYKPHYRAYFVAGKLYYLAKLPDLSGDRFILDSDGTYITVYYDDQAILTLAPQDASANNTTLSELANQYVQGLHTWANSIRKP